MATLMSYKLHLDASIMDNIRETFCFLEEISSLDLPTSNGNFRTDEIVLDELTSMCSSSKQHCNGRRGAIRSGR